MHCADGTRFGSHMAGGAYVAIAGNDRWKHRFGGDTWRPVDANKVFDGPVLLVVLDLSDERLATLRMRGLSELALCSYINCSVWDGRQRYRICPEEKTVVLLDRDVTHPQPLAPEDMLPNPLPEKPLVLQPLPENEECINEDSYWRACDEFLGGHSFIRVLGHPVWLQHVEQELCECSRIMETFCCIGYEHYESRTLLDGAPFFIGEGALYFSLCKECLRLTVTSQSS